MKIIITTIFLWTSFFSIGQNNTSINTINNEVLEETQNSTQLTDSPKVDLHKHEGITISKNAHLYSEKEWPKTKKKIQRNKKRYLKNSKTKKITSKIIDTIYFDIPSSSRRTRISEL